jgi:catechol 2,3-dioxygenase-like lactoylglutathione lyase family enzyme
MQMRLIAALFFAFTLSSPASSAPVRRSSSSPVPSIHRPLITGISHLTVYTSDPAAADHFYREILGAARLPDPENPRGVRYAFNATQFIEVLPLPAGVGVVRLDHTAWNTTNAEGMRRYLGANGWKVPEGVETGSDGSRWFTVLDPESNRVQFVQPPPHPRPVEAPAAIGHRIIHIGFMVHSRATEDKFYRDLLGFRPYWFGGMQTGKIDWVSQQVPNGHDWLEYMLTSGPSGSGIPATMTQRALGVLDHFSIGEVSVPDAYRELDAGNRLTGRHDQGPKIGRDGKYQFNLYDPDGIRVELMNFHATEKPCCSPFTASDPTPGDKLK